MLIKDVSVNRGADTGNDDYKYYLRTRRYKSHNVQPHASDTHWKTYWMTAG